METENVTMTAEERAEFEAFKAEREKKKAAEARKQQRDEYSKIVDDEIATAIPQLRQLSEDIKAVKDTIFNNFDTILKMKSEVLGLSKDDQTSHQFTNSEGDLRVMLGVNTIDGYRDTAEDGITMVRQYLEDLAKDDKTKALVSAVLRLLAKDQTGSIKASRVLQLRKLAEESGDEMFIEGVRIIEESYQPTTTKRFVRAAYRNDKGAWVNIPLSMTDVE
jgi:hypothetical protein